MHIIMIEIFACIEVYGVGNIYKAVSRCHQQTIEGAVQSGEIENSRYCALMDLSLSEVVDLAEIIISLNVEKLHI